MSDIYAFGTFSRTDEPSWPGVIRSGMVLPLASLLPDSPANLTTLFDQWDHWGARIHAAMADAPHAGWLDEQDLTIQLPYRPESLFGAGANYRRHVIDLIVDKGAGGMEHLDKDARRKAATEMMDARAATGKPFVFVANRRTIIGPRDVFVVPYDTSEPDWELELAVVIGKKARRVSREAALEHVAGYTVANDITSRELVARPDVPQMGMDWMACKGAPGYKIIGPYITPAAFVPDPQNLQIQLSLNGQVMQDEGTDDMIFNVARLIEFISAYAELYPGDIIMTGSPSGNGTHYDRFLRDGDVMTGEILGLVGTQVTPCQIEQRQD